MCFVIMAMTGGLCFMVDGKMCAGATKDRLMVRLDPAYVFVHPEGCESEAQLRHRLDLAFDFTPRAKASKKRRTG